MVDAVSFTPTNEEIEEIKREIFKNQLYRTDAFGNSLSEIEKIQQYILDHKSELIAKRQEKRNAQNQKEENAPEPAQVHDGDTNGRSGDVSAKRKKGNKHEVLSWFDEEKEDKHYIYEIKESNKAQNGSLGRKTRHSFVERDGKSDVFFVNATSRFEYDNKHTQELKAKDIKAKLNGSEFEGTILYGNKSNLQELKVKVKKENNVLVVVINGNQASFAADVFEKDGQQSSLYTFLRSQGFNDHDDYTSIAGSIVATYHDVQNISAILQSNESTVKNLANPPQITDRIKENKKEEEEEITPPTPDVITVEKRYRERSPNSDENAVELAAVQLETLLKIGKIDDNVYQAAQKDPIHAMKVINEKLPMNEKELQAFNDVMVGIMLDDTQKYGRLLLPSLLADSYEVTKALLDKERDYQKKQQLQYKKHQLGEIIDNLTDQYASGIRTITLDQYNYADNMNVADIYDGYIDMLRVREPDVAPKRKQTITDVRSRLDEQIAVYDDLWGISKDLTPDDNGRLADNHSYLTEQMASVEIEQEVYKLLGQIKFLDEQGKPEPQFVDKNGNATLTYSDGCSIKPDSKLATIVDFARNNTILANLTSKEHPSKEDLQAQLQIHILNDLYAVGKSEQAFRNIAELGGKYTTLDDIEDKKFEEIAKRVQTSLENPEVNWQISNDGYQAAVQTEVNNTMACINRLGKRIGATSLLLQKLHKPIAKHDDLRDYRFTKSGKLGGSWLKTFAWTTGASLANKAVAFGLHSVSGLSVGASAGIVAAGLSVTGIAINSLRFIKDAKAKGEKLKWQDFFFNFKKPYAATNDASILGFAAGACLMSGNLVGAGICGAAGLGILGYSTYKEARSQGASKKEAGKAVFKKLSAVVAGAATGSFLGSWLGMTPATPGKEPELIKEGQEAYTTHDYTKQELDWAATRNADPRYSEFLQKYHVAPDLQSSTDPNTVSADAMTNLKAAINFAIGDKGVFYTDIGDGQLQANTEMLTYKATQLLYLAQDPSAVTADGTPIGEVLSFTNPDGSSTNYIEAIQQAISTGKVENSEGFAQLLLKIENSIGGQIGDGVNDMGKITLFGTHDPVSPVQSYNATADVGYDIHPHAAVAPEYSQAVEATPEIKTYSFGYWEPFKNAFGKLKERVGALADKIIGKKETKVVPTPPKPEPKPEPKHEQQPTPQEPITPVVPTPQEQEPTTPKHEQPENNDVEEQIKALLDKEYEIVHGSEPNEKERERYRNLVQAEMQKNSLGTDSELAYMQERMKRFNETLQTQCAPLDNAERFCDTKEGKKRINMTRQLMWQTNLASDREVLESKNVTLLHFRELVGEVHNEGKSQNAAAARDSRRAPASKDKGVRPSDSVLDVTPKLKAAKKQSKPNRFITKGQTR